MNPILLAVIVVAVIGLVLGLLLAIASVVMAVPVDEKAAAIEEVLPGANCGACGFSGCSGYADALANGKTKETSLCAPGGAEVAAEVASLLGVAAGDVKPQSAVVHCNGTPDNCETTYEYAGVKTCKAAKMLYGGPKACKFACLGLGDCVASCEYDAIQICDGVARIDSSKCVSCKKCISACPQAIIDLALKNKDQAIVYCSNHDKGGKTRKECKVGCIGCMKCVKSCEFDAIHVDNFLAHVDSEKCTACGKCVEVCPQNCISMANLPSA